MRFVSEHFISLIKAQSTMADGTMPTSRGQSTDGGTCTLPSAPQTRAYRYLRYKGSPFTRVKTKVKDWSLLHSIEYMVALFLYEVEAAVESTTCRSVPTSVHASNEPKTAGNSVSPSNQEM